jgi:TonB family protein
MFGIHFDNAAWVQFLFDMTVRGTLIVALAVAAVWLWKRGSAATKHFVLTGALVGALALPLVMLAMSRADFVPPVQITAIQSLQVAGSSEGAAGGSGLHWGWLLTLWLCGTGFVLLSLLVGLARTRRIVKQAEPVTDGSWLVLLDACRRQLGVSQSVRLLITNRSLGPFVYGWLKPLLVLPAESESWSADRRRYFLLHELAHVRRRDVVMAPLSFVAAGLHWFNPVVWKCLDRVYLEREKACDDYVVASGVVAADYADELAGFARSVQKRDAYFLPGISMARRGYLVNRISSLLSFRNHAPFLKLSTAIAAALVTIGAVALLQCTETPIFPDKQKDKAAQALGQSKSGVEPPSEFVKVDVQPRMISQGNTVYPPDAKAAGVEGEVWVSAYLDTAGQVAQVKLAKSSGSKLLDDAALKSAWDCKFKPAKKDGKPVAVWVSFSVVFTLNKSDEK